MKKNYSKIHKMDIFESYLHIIVHILTKSVVFLICQQYASFHSIPTTIMRFLNFEGKYFRFNGMHSARIYSEHIVVLYVFQVWWQSNRNYDFYEVFKVLKESIFTFMVFS